MSLQGLVQSFPWFRYSRKLRSKILNPRNVGIFTAEDAKGRGMRLAVGFEGSIKDGNAVSFYWLVDPDDGIIVDSKFQVFGQSALIGAAEGACEVLVGKNYDQARRLSAEIIDREMRDKSDEPAFPWETSPHLNLVIGAIEEASEQCTDIPVAKTYEAPPTPQLGEVLEGGYPGWDELSTEQKSQVIEDVLDHEIRPYIALDGGGVDVVKFEEGRKLFITYQGACTSCMSSVGATLSYIQQTLRNRVHPEIIVIPEL
ncbi:MAG: Iron-sulfur cluster assembly scaffold protein IscU [Chlamydiae bacterium]|nr:Iron-sulfur cluster assembly scaffold protein IscU [Chlamydiota bacterium]